MENLTGWPFFSPLPPVSLYPSLVRIWLTLLVLAVGDRSLPIARSSRSCLCVREVDDPGLERR